MEEVCQNSIYRSAWRPLNRENELNSISTTKVLTNVIKDTEPPTVINKSSEQDELLKKLSDISTDIVTLNHMILDQDQKIDNLLSLLEEKKTSGKKNVFGLPRK